MLNFCRGLSPATPLVSTLVVTPLVFLSHPGCVAGLYILCRAPGSQGFVGNVPFGNSTMARRSFKDQHFLKLTPPLILDGIPDEPNPIQSAYIILPLIALVVVAFGRRRFWHLFDASHFLDPDCQLVILLSIIRCFSSSICSSSSSSMGG